MVLPIKFPINGGVLYPKIRAQIDNTRAGCQERLGQFSCDSVWQSEKNKTRFARDLFWIGIGKLERGRGLQVRETWENLGKRFAGQTSRRCRDKIDLRMCEEQTHEFLAGVTGSAHHRDLRSCHNAQCVFRLARIATKSCTRREDRINRIKWDL